jgi:hypothetical protein
MLVFQGFQEFGFLHDTGLLLYVNTNIKNVHVML